MSKVLVLGALLLATPFASFAAMPNYVGADYKQAADCVIPVDRGIYEIVGGLIELTGCISSTAWAREAADSASRQSAGYKFSAGESVVLRNGSVDTCSFAWGCVIDRILIR